MSDLVQIETKYFDTLNKLVEQYRSNKLDSLAPLLPFILRLKGKPYTLSDRPMMYPLFNTKMTRAVVVKSGRQISKTTTVVARTITYSALISDLVTLFVAPRFEQIRNISNNYAGPFLKHSPLYKFLVDRDSQSVLQRNLLNGSSLRFSFAFLNAERIRSISADVVCIDEFQDVDESFIPIIEETTSGSKLFDISFYTGTPKTLDNNLQKVWEQSSQGEWVTKCEYCNHYNIASIEYDLLEMLLPDYLGCAKCQREIDPINGFWEHRFPERLNDFPGYHVPQPIIPDHYKPNPLTNTRIKWKKIIKAKEKWTKARFYNEKLGEAYDELSSLITLAHLQRASSLSHDNVRSVAISIAKQYPIRILGVDWGGHGASQTSFTTLAVVCPQFGSERIDVIYVEKLPYNMDELSEMQYVFACFVAFGCRILAHDYAGSGSIRDLLLKQKGLKPSDLFPAFYSALTSGPIVTYAPSATDESRHMYIVDKTRSLHLICHMIKSNLITFPKFDSWKHLASHFTSLVEDVKEAKRHADIRYVTKKSGQSDDLAHSVNFACLAFWHSQNKFPTFASTLAPLSEEMEQILLGNQVPTEEDAADEFEPS